MLTQTRHRASYSGPASGGLGCEEDRSIGGIGRSGHGVLVYSPADLADFVVCLHGRQMIGQLPRRCRVRMKGWFVEDVPLLESIV